MRLPYWLTGLRITSCVLFGVLFTLTAAPLPVLAAGGLASTVLSMQGIDCQSCGMAAAAKLKGSEGVEDVSFDRGKAELAVSYDPSATDPATLASSVGELGYTVVVGEGKGRYLPDVEFSSELDVSWASRDGEAVDIEEHLAEGKVTVIDFYAKWCGPCRLVDREMFSILRARDDVALRKVNVNDWGSPVARQYLRKVPELPHVIVYSKTGRKVEAITGLDLQRLRAAIDRGASDG
jgi:thioredoxin 1